MTWTGASPSLAKMDEAQVVELPNGDVLANMRTDHLNSSCKCRATARSTDGGATWGPITFDPVLTSPVCAGSILRSGDQVSAPQGFFIISSSSVRFPVGLLLQPILCFGSSTWCPSTIIKWRSMGKLNSDLEWSLCVFISNRDAE